MHGNSLTEDVYIYIENKKMNVITKSVSLPDGRVISIENGKLAKQADGAVVLRMNNTVLLATVCGAKDAVPGTDFMPLQVEYREKYSAAGRFPGGFTKGAQHLYNKENSRRESAVFSADLIIIQGLSPVNDFSQIFNLP